MDYFTSTNIPAYRAAIRKELLLIAFLIGAILILKPFIPVTWPLIIFFAIYAASVVLSISRFFLSVKYGVVQGYTHQFYDKEEQPTKYWINLFVLGAIVIFLIMAAAWIYWAIYSSGKLAIT